MKTIICLLLFCSVAWGCEFGRTEKDTYGKPDSEEIEMMKAMPGVAMYRILPYTDTWSSKEFDKDGELWVFAGNDWNMSQWVFNHKIVDESLRPYLLYKGHRWYPNYHGTIYVYKNGREVK